MTRKTRDIITIVVATTVFCLGLFYVVMNHAFDSILAIGSSESSEAEHTVISGTDDLGNDYELYVYEENGGYANLYIYMNEDSTAKWVLENVQGESEVIYSKYDTDHYIISFKRVTDSAVAAFAFMPAEEKEDSHNEEYTKQYSLYTVTVDDAGYSVKCGILEDHFVPDESED